MARRPKQHGLPVAVIDNTLLTRLVNLEIAQFLPLLFKLQRFANGCASHLSFRGGLLPSGPTRTGGHSPPLNGHTQARTAISKPHIEAHILPLPREVLTCTPHRVAKELPGSPDRVGLGVEDHLLEPE